MCVCVCIRCSAAQPSGDAREVLDDGEDDNLNNATNLTEVAEDLAVQAAEGAAGAAQYHNVIMVRVS